MLYHPVVIGHKPVLSRERFARTSLRSSSPPCSLALVTNSSHSSLRVFRHLRTLSFLGSQLSRVLPTGCALFRKKPGVHPLVPSMPLTSPGTPFSRMATPPARRSFSEGGLTVDCQLSTVGFQLTPFPASLTQKQGGIEDWSYQSASLSTINCRLLTSHCVPPALPLFLLPVSGKYRFP